MEQTNHASAKSSSDILELEGKDRAKHADTDQIEELGSKNQTLQTEEKTEEGLRAEIDRLEGIVEKIDERKIFDS